MDRNLRKYTRNYLGDSHSHREIHIPYFVKFVFYSIVSAIIFLLVYSFFFFPEMTSNIYETTKDKVLDVLEKIMDKINPSKDNENLDIDNKKNESEIDSSNQDISNINDKINESNKINQSSSSEDNFRCQDELEVWLKEEKIKLSSRIKVKVIEKKSFTNKTNLLDYINKWGLFNKYDIRDRVDEITKIEEEPINLTHEIKREGKIIKLIYSFSEEDVNSLTLKVTKSYYNKNPEVVCKKTSEENSGEIICDLSEFGDGNYGAELLMDSVEKEPLVWEGQIDTVLIKEEGTINYNDVAILVMGICEEQGKLTFS